MTDLADDFAAMRAHTKERHAMLKRRNLMLLNLHAAGRFKSTNYGETLLFVNRASQRLTSILVQDVGEWQE